MRSNHNSNTQFDANRFFLKDTIRRQVDFSRTGQNRQVPAPPLQQACPPDAVRIDLPDGAASLIRLGRMPIGEAITQRESVRAYIATPLTTEELAALLWATQGVRKVLSPACALRTVPSAPTR